MTLRQSYTGPAHSGTAAFYVFLSFYVVCAMVTWWFFIRRPDARGVGVIHRTQVEELASVGVFDSPLCLKAPLVCSTARQELFKRPGQEHETQAQHYGGTISSNGG